MMSHMLTLRYTTVLLNNFHDNCFGTLLNNFHVNYSLLFQDVI